MYTILLMWIEKYIYECDCAIYHEYDYDINKSSKHLHL
jgi:hypothetical protein